MYNMYNECSYCITEALQVYRYITCTGEYIQTYQITTLNTCMYICPCNYVVVFLELNVLTEQNMSLHMWQCIVMYLYS